MQIFAEIHKPMDVQGSKNSVKTDHSVSGKEHSSHKSAGSVKKYDQISKDGDTLELSKPKISDAMLSGYSEARLKQLFNNKEISRQQYDKAINSKEEV